MLAACASPQVAGRQLSLDGMPQDAQFRQLWSARALVDAALHPLVVAAHRRYMEAGAAAITTNSYGVQPAYYRRAFRALADDNGALLERLAALVSVGSLAARASSASTSSANTRRVRCSAAASS